MKSIAEIDKNFEIPLTVNKTNVKFYSALSAPFTVCGLLYQNGRFRRIPEEISQTVSKNVHQLSANTAGGRIRFKTNSDVLSVLLL